MEAEEAHGLIAGWLCVNTAADEHWKTRLFDPALVPVTNLDELYQATAEALDSEDLEFELLLPAEDIALTERGGALVRWTSAFLTGLGLTGVDVSRFKNLDEPLRDLTEISKLAYEELADSEEDLQSFEEVAEFVRVAAMLVFTELRLRQGGDQTNVDTSNRTLH
jgi:uncharacterized protein YgfB (UPF0149 family)